MDEQEKFNKIMNEEPAEMEISDIVNGMMSSLDFLSYVILGSKFIGSDGAKIVYDRDRHIKAFEQMEKDFNGMAEKAVQDDEWPFPDPSPEPEEEEEDELK